MFEVETLDGHHGDQGCIYLQEHDIFQCTWEKGIL